MRTRHGLLSHKVTEVCTGGRLTLLSTQEKSKKGGDKELRFCSDAQFKVYFFSSRQISGLFKRWSRGCNFLPADCYMCKQRQDAFFSDCFKLWLDKRKEMTGCNLNKGRVSLQSFFISTKTHKNKRRTAALCFWCIGFSCPCNGKGNTGCSCEI